MAKGRKVRHRELVKRKKEERLAKRTQQKLTMPLSQLTPQEITIWKERLAYVINEANAKINELYSQGLTTIELNRFQNGDDSKIFSLEDIDDPLEIKAIVTQARDVINSAGENNRKAILETAMISAEYFRGQFGNQYQEGNQHFNIKDVINEHGDVIRQAINPDIASRAFRAYRRLEETYASVIGRQGKEGVYGSENLIIAIYDMESRGMDGQEYGRDLLELWMDEYLEGLENKTTPLNQADAIVGMWDDFINRRDF